MIKRVGIYAGSFDPVHAGHVSFALQALEAAGLDEVYFVPERRPRAKPGVEHYGHRVAMISRALQPHPALDVLELHDLSLNIDRTLPKLEARFVGHQLIFLFGSDVVKSLQDWPHIKRLLSNCEIVIGVRSGDDQASLKQLISAWPIQPMTVTMFDSFAPSVSSGQIRAALRERQPADGLLHSVARYSDHNWLYVSVGQPTKQLPPPQG